MTAEQHDLVGPFAADDLANDIGRLDVGLATSLEQQAKADTTAAPCEAHEPIGILGGNRRRRNRRHFGHVVHASGVRGTQSDRTDRSNEHRNGTVLRGRPRAAIPVRHRLGVAAVHHVEQHDLAACLRRPAAQIVEAVDDQQLRFEPTGGVATVPPRPRIARS